MPTEMTTGFDDDNDGNIDRIETYFYTNGRWTRTEFDDDADGNIDRVNFAENRIVAYGAPDAEGDTLVYSLSGTDAALFTIDGDTGAVSFRAAPDFEMPGDDDGDNVYDIVVTASDGTPDRINHYTFDDDGNGRVTRRDFDLDDDGTIDRTAHVNADGRWERVERDLDDDGNIDRIDHYTFAADGTGRRPHYADAEGSKILC